ncbi:Arabinan endo-1,5-alpha-L-arabinosidase A [Lachnellula subtilissima]|uniref:Endo-1,5-alpha-L-arabinanase A n=1 Tax=Lachnellula subtilissima TaxID=602034 RepID=A0A8H8UHL9_9HELO|nr:Arabinan endo-1,5-alpha-L-arabinosidase A [Lachnellula subtilissima]
MFSLLRSATAFLIATASLVQGYSDPGACSGACWAHDPSIIQRTSDDLYFKFNTGSGVEIATASSLSGPWTIKGYALPSGSKIDLANNTDLWAPDVHKVGDLYYMYYAVSTFGSQTSAIGLATSSTMDIGSWTDLGATGVASSSGKAYNAIDPNLIAVGSSYYLNFGSFWHDIYQVPMSSDAKKTSGTSVNIEYDSAGTHPCEGSYMFYYSGYYYLLWSHGICCGYDTCALVSQDTDLVPQDQTRDRRRVQNNDVQVDIRNWRLCRPERCCMYFKRRISITRKPRDYLWPRWTASPSFPVVPPEANLFGTEVCLPTQAKD